MWMAIIAVPRSVFKMFVWLVMAGVGWVVAAAENAYAAVTYSFNSTTGRLTILSDSLAFDVDETIIVTSNEDASVRIWDGTTAIDTSVEAADVLSISIAAGGGADSINASEIDEAVYLNLLTSGVTINGGPGNDQLVGRAYSLGDDWIVGGDGDDRIWGRAGNDDLFGDAGNDSLYGEAGDDWLRAGDGNNVLQGGLGSDLIDGGPGNDDLYHNDIAAGNTCDGGFDCILGNVGGSPQAGDRAWYCPDPFPDDNDDSDVPQQ